MQVSTPTVVIIIIKRLSNYHLPKIFKDGHV